MGVSTLRTNVGRLVAYNAILAVVICANVGAATFTDTNFSETTFVADDVRMGNNPASPDGQVNGITCMAWAPDGANRLYVTVKGRSDANGHIQVIRDGVLQSEPFYTFNTGLETNNECGLMSLVFHPDYATGTKQIYCFVTVSTTEQRVVRFTEVINGNGNYVASGAPTTMVANIPTAGQNHNGGGLAIAPDQNGNGRFLYWASGNNGNGVNRGERLDTTNLGAKLGRANLDGSIPTDGLNSSGYIWAYGYRNAFTMTHQPATGKLWVSVVGDSYEQIFQPTPGSYAGDNDFENLGNSGIAQHIPPIIKYRTNGNDTRTLSAATRSGSTVTYTTTGNHGFRKGELITVSSVTPASFNGGVYVLATPTATTFTATLAGADTTATAFGTAATQNLGGVVTGGAFYDKSLWPAQYQGNYFFGDYNSGRIMRVQLNADNSIKQVDTFATGGGRVIDVSFGPDGNMYYAVINSGVVRRVTLSQLTITTGTLPATTVGATYNQTLAATGGTTPYTWAVITGALPGGLTLNTSSGAITGTPTGTGTFNFTVRATDTGSRTGQKDFSIVVNAAPNITTTTLPGGNVGVAYNQTLASTGGTGTKTWSISVGTLPAGLSLNTGTGAITGTPTTAATSNFTARVVDSVGVADTQALSIVVTTGNSAPAITSTAVTVGNIGVAYSYDVNASGNPAPTYSLTASPSGMTINTSSGVISWTPSAKGTFNVTVQAANGVNPNATQSFSINVTDYGLFTRPTAAVNLGLNPAALPATLSATNVFSNLANLTPANALIPYTVNSPLWSDASSKSRWFSVPNDGAPYTASEQLGYAPTGEWTFPQGTVLVKHFELNTDERNPSIKKRLETRLLFVNADGTVFGATYKWRADNTNADLLPDFVDEDITITTASGGTRVQRWHYPSRTECLQCHNSNTGGVLGIKTRQQNGSFTYPSTGVTDNQLRTWNFIKLINTTLVETDIPALPKLAPLGDTATSLEHRVRSYIDSNCSHCHRPAGAPALFDARFDTPLGGQNIINGTVNNTLGVADAKVVVPRDVLKSILHKRTDTVDPTFKMPPLARNVIDTQAVAVIQAWIDSLPNGTGLNGIYYDNIDFTGTSVSRVDPEINFNWGTGAPITGIGVDTFSVRWTGQIQAPYSETFTFYTRTDDGVRLWVNGQLLVDKWVNQSATEWSGTIALTAGLNYTVVMEYYENGGGAEAQLSWSSPSTPKGIIPANVVFPVAPPSAPTILTAAASSSTQINLGWTDNATNESGFEVERSPDGTAWAALVTKPLDSTSHSDTGLTAATTYHYRVRASNFAGKSAFAGPASATTMSGGGGGNLPVGGLKINFQPSGVPIPAGYIADTGAVFGDRGNGYSYGWNVNTAATSRDRNSPASPDQRYDTLLHLQKPENPNGVWEIALPNGTYNVRVVSGDPSHIDSVFKMNVEGVLTVNGTPTAAQHWFEGTRTVTLTDGRITLGNGTGAANNKICFVDITEPPAGAVAAREDGDPLADAVIFLPATAESIAVAMNAKAKSQSGRLIIDLPGANTVAVLEGQVVGIDLGGAVIEFTLDKRGRATTKAGRCTVKLNAKKQKVTITVAFKGSWAEAWSDGGLVANEKETALPMPFSVTFDGQTYGGVRTVNFNGRNGRSNK